MLLGVLRFICNCVSIFAYGRYLFIVAIGIEIPNKFDMSRPEDKTKLLSVMDTLDESTKRFQRYIMITSVNVMVCFVRFFKFVKVRLRFVTPSAFFSA